MIKSHGVPRVCCLYLKIGPLAELSVREADSLQVFRGNTNKDPSVAQRPTIPDVSARLHPYQVVPRLPYRNRESSFLPA